MNAVLTVAEQHLVKTAAGLLSQLLKFLWQRVRVGGSGKDLVTATWSFLKAHNCASNFYQYHGFPAPICVSVNANLIHGVPNATPFVAGDVVSVDAGVLYQNKWHSDAAFTKIVGQPRTTTDQLLVSTCAQALLAAIGTVQPHMRVGTLGHVIAHCVQQQGFFCPANYTGHAIGRALHMLPLVPNTGVPNTGAQLRPGMIICIEPMVMAKTPLVTTTADGWTVRNRYQANTAHFEAMVLIKSSGVELLTPILE